MDEVEANNRDGGCLSRKGYKNLGDKFAEKTRKTLTKKQFKNKWDALKKEYTGWMELQNATGLGWDPVKKTMDADDEWWKTHLAYRPEHAKFRNGPPANMEQQDVMFRQAHVTGESSAIPGEQEPGEGMAGAILLDDDGEEVKKTPLGKHEPRRIPQQSGIEWVHEQLGNRKRCYKMFRMYPDVFGKLHNLLVAEYGLQSTRDMQSIECLAMFLWTVGGPQSFTQVENHFSRSLETIHRKFQMVLMCLYKLGKDNIKPVDREFKDVHPRVQDPRFWPHFKGAIGAIDGSHIPVEVEEKEQVNHTGRHGYTSQNILAICDFDLRFTFVVAGWPGSAHDTRILNRSIEKYKKNFPTPPDGTYYLVDSGYPNKKGYLAPYKNNTYHIPDFRREGLPTEKEEMFNYAHAQMRNAIERNFGILKNKWRALKGLPLFTLVTQKRIILACCALHNFIRDSNLRDKQFDRCDSDENYIPKVQRQAVTLPGDNAPGGQHTRTMNSVRDEIADSLFNARAN